MQISDMNMLIDQIYKAAYLDGFEDALMPCITKKYNQFSDYITGRRNLSGIYFARQRRGEESEWQK